MYAEIKAVALPEETNGRVACRYIGQITCCYSNPINIRLKVFRAKGPAASEAAVCLGVKRKCP